MEKLNSFEFLNTQIGFITECVEPINGVLSFRDAMSYFEGNDELEAIPVEIESGYGILSRDYLERNKVSVLNMSKAISSFNLINSSSRSFNSRENVRKIFIDIAKTEADEQRFYIVYHNNNLFGVVSLHNIIRHISDLQEWEINHARSIQKSILRENLIQGKGFKVQSDIRWAHDLGGDYYYSAAITENLSLVSCFDVESDHMTASLVSVMIDSYFKTRSLMENFEKEDVEKLILSLNSFLLGQLPEDSSVSAIFLFIRQDERKVYLYNFAYTAPFLILSEEGKIRAKRIAPQYHPLGKEDIVIFREAPQIYSMENLHHIFIYSDGMRDCVNAFGEHFGMDRIQECLIKNFKLMGDGFLDILAKEIDEFRHDTPLVDDIASLIVNFE